MKTVELIKCQLLNIGDPKGDYFRYVAKNDFVQWIEEQVLPWGTNIGKIQDSLWVEEDFFPTSPSLSSRDFLEEVFEIKVGHKKKANTREMFLYFPWEEYLMFSEVFYRRLQRSSDYGELSKKRGFYIRHNRHLSLDQYLRNVNKSTARNRYIRKWIVEKYGYSTLQNASLFLG